MSKPALIGATSGDIASSTQPETEATQPETDSLTTLFNKHAGAEVQINKTETRRVHENHTVTVYKMELSSSALDSEAIRDFRKYAEQQNINLNVVISRKEVVPVDIRHPRLSQARPVLYLNLAKQGDKHFIHSYTLR